MGDGGGSISHAPGPSCTKGPGAIVLPVVQDQAALDEMTGRWTACAQEWIADDAAYAQRCPAFARVVRRVHHPHRYAGWGASRQAAQDTRATSPMHHDTRTFEILNQPADGVVLAVGSKFAEVVATLAALPRSGRHERRRSGRPSSKKPPR